MNPRPRSVATRVTREVDSRVPVQVAYCRVAIPTGEAAAWDEAVVLELSAAVE